MTFDNLVSLKSNPKNRILAIGIDSAEPKLIEKWMNEGKLPFMQSLKDKGAWVRIKSTANWLSDTPWPTFYTGVNPGKHGYYSFLNIKRGTTEIKRINARSCKYLPFWGQLSGSDKKVVIFDVPKTYPLEALNGIQLAAWGEEYPLMPTSCLPESFKDEFLKNFGSYQHITELVKPIKIAPELKIYNILMKNIKKKSRAIQDLLLQNNWDFFIAAFGEIHYANHQFFHHFDVNHWGHDSRKAKHLDRALLNIYRAIDVELANIFKDIPENTTIFVFSVHGIKTNYAGNHLMNSIMEKLGYQVRATPIQTKTTGFDLKNLSKLTKKMIPGKLREYINERFVPNSVHDEFLSWEFNNRISWRDSKAFFMPNSIFQSFISVNLKGREPLGIVEPGEEYEKLCYEICHEFKQLVNPKTGKSAIKDIAITADIFPGEHVLNLPDIILQWAEDGPIEQLEHPKLRVISEPVPDLRKTQHAGEGFMLTAGKGVQPQNDINTIDVLDLAPTMLSLLGEEIPEYMKGRILTELFEI